MPSDKVEPEEFEETPINTQEADLSENIERKDESINSLMRVRMPIQVVLGTTKMTVEQLLNLGRGAVIELDRRVGDPVDVMINDRVVARGELVDVGENTVGVNLKEIVKEHLTGDL